MFLDDINITNIILSFCHSIDLLQCSCVSRQLRQASDDENLWKSLCERGNIQQQSRRARGVKLWKSLFLSNLCVECNNDGINGNGIIKVDIEGGCLSRRVNTVIINRIITLCGNCFNTVRSIPIKERKKDLSLLPNINAKLCKQGLDINYAQLIYKIPEYKQRKSKATRLFDDKYDNPDVNNTLLRLIKRKSSSSSNTT